jgi:inosose dehydratase
MTESLTRRELFHRFGTAALAAPLLRRVLSSQDIRLGYASITWDGRDQEAIADIAALGFRGIQLRSNVMTRYESRPAALRELLDRHGLSLVAFSSGNLGVDPATERDQLDRHTRHADFVRQVSGGGAFLQIVDERPRDRAVRAADYARLGRLLTELGKRTADLGIPLGYHHHMGSIGERPEEIRAVLDATDPRFVKLALDTAHFHQGGGDPAQAVREYADRLLYLHIKDLDGPPYRFVELGRGKVNFQRVFGALSDVKFNGWAIVELDRVPEPTRSPKESASISKHYLESTLGLTP